jgi:hypothetical protein
MDNIQDHLFFINQALGNGGIWKAKNYSDSNLYKLLSVIAEVHTDIKNYQEHYGDQLNVYKATQDSIELWEKYVGIPDNVFIQTFNLGLADRIRQVILKLIGFEDITLPRLKYILSSIFNISQVKITRGSEAVCFPIIFGSFYFGTKHSARQNLHISLPKKLPNQGFPYTFPFTFQTNQAIIVENFIKMITPFQYNVYIDYTL